MPDFRFELVRDMRVEGAAQGNILHLVTAADAKQGFI